MSRKMTAMFLSVFMVFSVIVVPASAAEFKGGTAFPAYDIVGRRKLNENREQQFDLDVQHQKRPCKRYISAENRFHAY